MHIILHHHHQMAKVLQEQWYLDVYKRQILMEKQAEMEKAGEDNDAE